MSSFRWRTLVWTLLALTLVFEATFALAGHPMLSRYVESLGDALYSPSGEEPPQDPDDGFDGDVEVPGTDQKIKYKITTKKTEDGRLQVWMELMDKKDEPEKPPIKMVLCAMLNFDAPSMEHKAWTIAPEECDDGEVRLKCKMAGTIDVPSSHHFGCKQVEVPQGGMTAAFHETVDGPLADEDVQTMYFDVLKDFPLDASCDGVKGDKQFLAPTTSAVETNMDDWANVWGGDGPVDVPTPSLTASPSAHGSWPMGNWVTMGHPAIYPARIAGQVTGAPAGTQVRLVIDGLPGPTHEVAPDPAGGSCAGLPLDVESMYDIPAALDADAGIEIFLPSDTCGQVPEGTKIRWRADVLAESGAPFYAPGDFMYAVQYNFIRDTTSPTVMMANVESLGTQLYVEAEAVDLETGPLAGLLVEGPGLRREVLLDFAGPALPGEVVYFEQTLDDLPLATPLTYRLRIYDEMDNYRDAAAGEAWLVPRLGGPIDPPTPGVR